MNHVIVGAGPAGVIAAENLRKLDRGASIILVGDEPEAPYSRMAIPYLLAENIAEEGTHLRHTAGHFENLNVELRQGRVASVAPDKASLTLDDGGSLSYDKLLLATGSHPVRPPIPGMDLDNVESCWTLDDARHIIAKARSGDRVVLMGAGFIGCIILEALVARGVDLTVIEMEDRMVARMMDKPGGDIIKAWCEAKGVKVMTSTRVEAVEKAGGGLHLTLNNDAKGIDADLVVCATGVKPNTAFLDGSGIETATGIRVNNFLETSVANIYAAGDVAEGPDFSTGGYDVHAIQPTASEHGRIAARNMAGRKTRFKGSLVMNVLNTLGLISSSYGLWDGAKGGDQSVMVDPAHSTYLRLNFKDDKLVGSLSLGLTQHVGVLRGLIQTEVPLGKWKDRLMEDPHLIMHAYLERTQGVLQHS
jgi:NAD(P)H-nitrite reductase large subunit